jgi:hypothetical protein
VSLCKGGVVVLGTTIAYSYTYVYTTVVCVPRDIPMLSMQLVQSKHTFLQTAFSLMVFDMRSASDSWTTERCEHLEPPVCWQVICYAASNIPHGLRVRTPDHSDSHPIYVLRSTHACQPKDLLAEIVVAGTVYVQVRERCGRICEIRKSCTAS